MRHDSRNIQSKNSITMFLVALNAFKKEKKLVYLKKGVINNCILPYILGMPIDRYKKLDSNAFLKYCTYAEKEFISQYGDILKKDPRLLPLFIEEKEQFLKLIEETKK